MAGSLTRSPEVKDVAVLVCCESDCELPASGWGRIHLAKTTPEVGKRYTDSGALHDSKGLKHRPDDEVRPVPIPPQLVTLLRWHLGEFGTASDGRLFRQPNGRIVGSSTYSQVWQAAREIAFTPAQVASPLAGCPYDLRHAAVSLWLNAGVPTPTVASELVTRWRCCSACTPTASMGTKRWQTSA
jgi:integrase